MRYFRTDRLLSRVCDINCLFLANILMLPRMTFRLELLKVPNKYPNIPDINPNKALFGLRFNVFMFEKLYLMFLTL